MDNPNQEENPTTDTTAADTAQEAEQSQHAELDVEQLKAQLKEVRAEAARYRTERNALKQDAEAWQKHQDEEKTELQRILNPEGDEPKNTHPQGTGRASKQRH